MGKPHKCPKCNGTGFLPFDPLMGWQVSTTSCGPWQCNVCQSGIIWETGDIKPYELQQAIGEDDE